MNINSDGCSITGHEIFKARPKDPSAKSVKHSYVFGATTLASPVLKTRHAKHLTYGYLYLYTHIPLLETTTENKTKVLSQLSAKLGIEYAIQSAATIFQ